MSSSPTDRYDLSLPWNEGVDGKEILEFINEDRPVYRIQAGAGTGKTFGLKKRVLRIRHPKGLGVAHERVLVCAFNRVIARDLEREIRKELDPFKLALPTIKTVHALCTLLLKGQPPRMLLPHEIDEMVYDLLAEHASLSQEYSQPKAVRALREHEAGFKKHVALAQAQRAWLVDHGACLIGDVPLKVNAALRAGELQDRYEHVLVDEWQDLTLTEVTVVVALRLQPSCFAAVGDHKQRIYSFRGMASGGLKSLGEYVKEPITDITMDECRRCPSVIVALANEVMALEKEPLRSVRVGGQIHRIRWRTPKQEAEGMAPHIAKVYNAKRAAKHLVLVTRRRWGYALRNALRTAAPDVPVQTVFSEDALETWPAREAFMFFSIIGEPKDAVTLRDWVSYRQHTAGKKFLATNRNSEAYLALKADGGVLNLQRALVLSQKKLTELHGQGKGNILVRLKRLRDFADRVPFDNSPGALINFVFDPELWIDFEGEDTELAREDIVRLRVEALEVLGDNPELRTSDVVRQLRYRIATREPIGTEDVEGVRIVTLWGAKGLTAEYVYLIGLCDEALPGPYDPESTSLSPAEYEAEQRRLLFVSVTRAREALVISQAEIIQQGQIRPLHLIEHEGGPMYWQSLTRTRFFDDLSDDALPIAVHGSRWKGIRL